MDLGRIRSERAIGGELVQKNRCQIDGFFPTKFMCLF